MHMRSYVGMWIYKYDMLEDLYESYVSNMWM